MEILHLGKQVWGNTGFGVERGQIGVCGLGPGKLVWVVLGRFGVAGGRFGVVWVLVSWFGVILGLFGMKRGQFGVVWGPGKLVFVVVLGLFGVEMGNLGGLGSW